MSHAATIVSMQNNYFYTGQTKDYEFRRDALIKLKQAVVKNEAAIFDALKAEDVYKRQALHVPYTAQKYSVFPFRAKNQKCLW